MLEGHRHEQMPPLCAVALAIVEQPACAREPAAGAGELAAVQQDEDQPARASGGPQHVTPAQELVMRALPHLDAVLVPADEVRRRGQPLEVLRLERGLAIRRGQLGEGIRPRPPGERTPGRARVPRPSSRPGSDVRHESIVRPPKWRE